MSGSTARVPTIASGQREVKWIEVRITMLAHPSNFYKHADRSIGSTRHCIHPHRYLPPREVILGYDDISSTKQPNPGQSISSPYLAPPVYRASMGCRLPDFDRLRRRLEAHQAGQSWRDTKSAPRPHVSYLEKASKTHTPHDSSDDLDMDVRSIGSIQDGQSLWGRWCT